MWSEIRNKAKLTLIPSLLAAKTTNAKHDSIPSLDQVDENTFPLERPATKAAIDQWKFIIDILIKHDLI